jgi:hypothetical protein
MKYFTPELYVRGQSQDDAILDQVEEEWEANVDAYAAHLQAIRPELPAGLLYLLDNFYLHDANVLSAGSNRDTFVMVLQLDSAYATLVLTYRLTEEVRIDRAALPPEHSGPYPVQWMYDEIDAPRSDRPGYVHNVLLSNGWELELHFHDLEVTAVNPLPLSASDQRRLQAALRVVGPYTVPPQPTTSQA